MKVILSILCLVTLLATTYAVAKQEDISIEAKPYNIQGTLYMPKTSSRSLVVIVPGSGPVNRYGDVIDFGSKSGCYSKMAEFFASNNIAAFIYDKRWITHIEIASVFAEEDHICDLKTIIAHFVADPRFHRKVILLGHSEGGSIAIAIAVASRIKTVSKVVIASSAAFPIDQLLLEQTAGNVQLNKELRRLIALLHNKTFPSGGIMLGASRDYWLQWIEITSNVPTYIQRSNSQFFVVQGLSDEMLPGSCLKRNIESWESIAKQNVRVAFKSYGYVDHRLCSVKDKKLSAELMNDIISFIRVE